MKVALFYNPQTNPDNKLFAQKVSDVLKNYRLSSILNPQEGDLNSIDLAIAVGGDGTVLYVANLVANFKIPILGINFGHRGYLCQVKSTDIEAAIQNIAHKRYTLFEKTRLQAEIRKRNGSTSLLEALNEISIGGINRTVHLDTVIVTPDKTLKAQITGDGLIVATQTGSTAYNINAGGPILLTEAFSLVANNAFFESNTLLPSSKSIVIPTDSTITIEDLSHKTANLPYVIADGQEAIKIDIDDTVTVKKSNNISYFLNF